MMIDHRSSRRSNAFSFIEVLTAVALSGMLLAAASSLLFSFAHVWAQIETEPRFDRHVSNTSSFLQYCFDHSANLSGDPAQPLVWKNPPESSQPALHFRLEEPNPFFVSTVKPLAPVDGFIRFHEDEGLSIIWHHPPRFTNNKVELKRTPLSPIASNLEFGFFNSENETWEFKSAAGDNRDLYSQPPEIVRITFQQNRREQSRILPLTRTFSNVTTY